jgi:hypothetical protein
MLGFEQKVTRKKNCLNSLTIECKKETSSFVKSTDCEVFKYWTLLLHGFDLNWTSLRMVMNNNVYQDKMIIDVWCFW